MYRLAKMMALSAPWKFTRRVFAPRTHKTLCTHVLLVSRPTLSETATQRSRTTRRAAFRLGFSLQRARSAREIFLSSHSENFLKFFSCFSCVFVFRRKPPLEDNMMMCVNLIKEGVQMKAFISTHSQRKEAFEDFYFSIYCQLSPFTRQRHKNFSQWQKKGEKAMLFMARVSSHLND